VVHQSRQGRGLSDVFDQFRSVHVSLWHLISTLVLPLSAFLFARRHYPVTPSLLPASLVFAAVTFVFLNIGLGLGYTS
jgi:hypothetical protein